MASSTYLPETHRTLPQSLDSEKGLLCCCMVSDKAIAGAIERKVEREIFHHPAHQEIWTVLVALFVAGKARDLVPVTTELEKLGRLEHVGGDGAVAEIFGFLGSGGGWEYYVEILRECWVARTAIAFAMEVAAAGYEPSERNRVSEIAQTGFSKIASLTESRAVTRKFNEVMIETVDEIQAINDGTKLSGLGTGLARLDTAIQGLMPGHVIVIAAQTKRGKSTLGIQIARHNAERKVPVGIFSLEMSALEIGLKSLSAQTRINFAKMKKGFLDTGKMSAISRALTAMGEYPIFIRDESVITPSQFQAAARRLVRENGCKLLVVDYLQLFSTDEKDARSREQQVATSSRLIKTTAGELQVPIIIMSQLNDEDRARESKAIENDSNIFLIVEEQPVMEGSGKSAKPRLDENGEEVTTHSIYVKYARFSARTRIPVRFLKEFSTFEDDYGN